jgi:hypothetical protein
MPVHTSWAARRSNVSLFALILAVLALAGCGGGKQLELLRASRCSLLGGRHQLHWDPVPDFSRQSDHRSSQPACHSEQYRPWHGHHPLRPVLLRSRGQWDPWLFHRSRGHPDAAGWYNPLAVTVDPTSKFLYVSDTYHSRLAGFAIDSSTGALSQVPGRHFQMASPQIALPSLHPASSFTWWMAARTVESPGFPPMA